MNAVGMEWKRDGLVYSIYQVEVNFSFLGEKKQMFCSIFFL